MAKGRIPDALFWDTADPYHYLRIEPHRDHDVVIFGGEDHKTGQAPTPRRASIGSSRRWLSLIGEIEITHRWSGQVIETPDGLPYIGETAAHQFAGTGFSGNGMTFGTLAGMMAADRIAGRDEPVERAVRSGRAKSRRRRCGTTSRRTRTTRTTSIRDRFAGAEGKSLRAVPRGRARCSS